MSTSLTWKKHYYFQHRSLAFHLIWQKSENMPIRSHKCTKQIKVQLKTSMKHREKLRTMLHSMGRQPYDLFYQQCTNIHFSFFIIIIIPALFTKRLPPAKNRGHFTRFFLCCSKLYKPCLFLNLILNIYIIMSKGNVLKWLSAFLRKVMSFK
jgi:hypothetical protein